jgi:hypothetical protein
MTGFEDHHYQVSRRFSPIGARNQTVTPLSMASWLAKAADDRLRVAGVCRAASGAVELHYCAAIGDRRRRLQLICIKIRYAPVWHATPSLERK